ncbi:hypothetical protein POM88_016659 [Heracleum sosnowskyi]|uniref:RRM domain-containing protein n=1 Tax=Heracleum sosnowskyi TaxID=360622 RepID=A0AAD8IPB2_9APIA|nr:hypothetical protein POM88_016659 [Heracleum sosnowskyi]
MVDKGVFVKYKIGDRQTITEILNQIHWRSLKRVHTPSKGYEDSKMTYVNAVNYQPREKFTESHFKGVNDSWTLVTSKRNKKLKNAEGRSQPNQDSSSDKTIFMVNIHQEAKTSALWNFFKRCGNIKDIILPKKRDKNNKRIGFIKTSSELEAGIIISNATELGGWGRRIAMSINQDKRESTGKIGYSKEVKSKNVKEPKVFVPKKATKDYKVFENEDISTKMFAYIEAEIDDRVEEGLFKTMVGFSWGLPMNAWLEENLKAFTKRFGEWISRSYQVDDSNTFVHPLICVATTNWETIDFDLIVLVKGKNYTIKFKEVEDIKLYLDGKTSPMNDSFGEMSNPSKKSYDKVDNKLVPQDSTSPSDGSDVDNPESEVHNISRVLEPTGLVSDNSSTRVSYTSLDTNNSTPPEACGALVVHTKITYLRKGKL